MGWGKFLGDLGKEYLSDRGIGGALEDANNIKEGLSRLFGGGSSQANNEIDEETYQAQYRQDWEDTIEKVNEYLRANQYDEARKQLEAFYEYYEEEHDWWHSYHTTRIFGCEFEDVYICPLLDDDNRDTELSSKAKAFMRKLQKNIRQVIDTAEGEEQQERAEGLTSIVCDDDTINGILNEHKLWNEVDELTNTQRVVTESKNDDFKKALQLVENYYKSYADIAKAEAKAKVYIEQLQYLIDNEEARIENKDSFEPLYAEISQCSETLKRAVTKLEKDDQTKYLHLLDRLKVQLSMTKQLMTLTTLPQQTVKAATNAVPSSDEQEYIDELKACLADDGSISDRERRLLDKLRKSLGISEQRAAEIEASLKAGLTEEEQEYVNALKDSLIDGTISDRERRILNRLRTSLNISEERAKELEKSLS